MPVKDSKKHMVIFQPSGRRGYIDEGKTIKQASVQLGVDIEGVCGEKGLCGKCQVKIEEGIFDKYGITSGKKHVTPMMESERIPHSLLFAGPYGVGKGETAFEIARMLLCENGISSGCTTCGSCRRVSKFEHPDLHILFPFKAPPEKAENYEKWMEGIQEHRKLLAEEQYAPVIYEKGRQIVAVLVNEINTWLQESSFEGGYKICVILSLSSMR